MIRKCVDCGKAFEITDGEKGFYESKGLELPKRCPECRKRRREKKESPAGKKAPLWLVILAAALLIALVVTLMTPSGDEDGKPIEYKDYYFRTEKLLNEHYEKHGKEMGFSSAEDYRIAASRVICDPDSLHKTEKEDGDDVYYLEKTNEFVILSKDGYIRTYFCPDSGKSYYDRQ